MRKFSLVAGCLGTLIIAGSSSNAVSPTYLEDGTEAFMANCSGAGRTWANCEFEAGEECGKRGFEVIAKTSEPYSMGSSLSGLYGGPNFGTQETVVMGSSNALAIMPHSLHQVATILGFLSLLAICRWLYRTSF